MSDTLRYIGKLSVRKAINGLKVLSSYYYSRFSGKPRHWGMPVSIAIEPTTSCNLRCPECPSGLREFTRPTGMLEETMFRKTIDELKSKLTYLTFYFQGEPYLHPGFLDMVKYASANRIYTATSTNAHYLSEENARLTVESGLDRLIISIDGATQESYEAYRVGGSLDKVIEGTKNIIAWKKKLKARTPHVIFQFLVVKPNEHETGKIEEMAKELGVDEVRFKTAQVMSDDDKNDLIPTNEKYSRYRKNASGKYELRNKLEDHCWKMWHSCVITWDGLVVPCCFDKDASHRLGDLKSNSFAEIWQGTAYKNFRTSVFRSRKEVDICTNCTEGTRVWA